MSVSYRPLDLIGGEMGTEVSPVGVCGVEAQQPFLQTTMPLSEPLESTGQRATELMRRIAIGDEAALAELYAQLGPTLMGLALKMMGDRKEAEDVLQEGFIYIWRKAAAYNPLLGGPLSWAVRIVRNKAIDRLRVRRRNERLVERATIEFTHFPDADERSAEEPIFGEKRAVLRAALEHISKDQREALELAFFGGFTQMEIALRLAVPLGTIKARIRRGLLRLRDYLMETQ